MASAEYIPVWRLRKIVGVLKAERLLAAHGGTTIYVAAKQHEGGKLARVIGIEAAQLLADEFAVQASRTRSDNLAPIGVRLALPTGGQGTAAKLRAKTALLAEDGDLSTVEIARRLGISERTVRRHRAKARAVSLPLQAFTG